MTREPQVWPVLWVFSKCIKLVIFISLSFLTSTYIARILTDNTEDVKKIKYIETYDFSSKRLSWKWYIL